MAVGRVPALWLLKEANLTDTILEKWMVLLTMTASVSIAVIHLGHLDRHDSHAGGHVGPLGFIWGTNGRWKLKGTPTCGGLDFLELLKKVPKIETGECRTWAKYMKIKPGELLGKTLLWDAALSGVAWAWLAVSLLIRSWANWGRPLRRCNRRAARI
jgi:hypothetical protein